MGDITIFIILYVRGKFFCTVEIEFLDFGFVWEGMWAVYRVLLLYF